MRTCSILHNEGLHNLSSSCNNIRVTEPKRFVVHTGKQELQTFWLERSIIMYLKEKDVKVPDLIKMAQDRV
jgi:hypothetical protein